MVIPTKKLKNGFEMPVFGLGTYAMGQGSPEDDQKDISAITASIKLGITHIDTAEVYSNGHTEELVQKGIEDFDRKKLFLVSKAEASHLNHADIKHALKNSLKRLGTNYLDLYLMHRCPEEGKFKETVFAMNELVEEGLVRYIGLSNTNTEHTKRLCALSRHPFVANQVHYNLQFREPQKDGLVEYCQKNDMMLIAWRPVNKGSLTKSGVDITRSGIKILDAMCEKYHKTPAQIAINWLVTQSNITTIAKSSNPQHLKENLGGIGWRMDDADVEILKKEFPDQRFLSDTVPLA